MPQMSDKSHTHSSSAFQRTYNMRSLVSFPTAFINADRAIMRSLENASSRRDCKYSTSTSVLIQVLSVSSRTVFSNFRYESDCYITILLQSSLPSDRSSWAQNQKCNSHYQISCDVSTTRHHEYSMKEETLYITTGRPSAQETGAEPRCKNEKTYSNIFGGMSSL